MASNSSCSIRTLSDVAPISTSNLGRENLIVCEYHSLDNDVQLSTIFGLMCHSSVVGSSPVIRDNASRVEVW